ncbi:MAG: ribosome biogenesis GTP-binding protein YihA/YsxC [Desulfovibrio sp.]|jgi:GTP-binding protein|nr:ribosome biogenesis GTP-binding protein YihA/YsxC [Desulfovibrio sp.]
MDNAFFSPLRLTLAATVFSKVQLLHAHAPQAALAGRSNVGKSSLLNALAGAKKLARVSSAPGKTRSLNFYRIGGSDAFIVDLPGYGYAERANMERRNWAELMEHYLRFSPGLKTLVLLLDARLPPQKSDLALLAFASSLALPILPVLAKADKCSKKELAACLSAWLPLAGGTPLVTSAEKGLGLAELKASLQEILFPQPVL